MPPDANSPALPEPKTVPVQFAVVYSLTVEPASAVPRILGELSLPGDAGALPDGAGVAGAIESWMYVSADEQADTFPAGSVVFA